MAKPFEYGDSIIYNLRSGDPDLDPYLPFVDVPYKIINGAVLLHELPVKLNKVQVKDTSTIPVTPYFEVVDKVPAEFEYVVDYNVGIIRFNPSAEGKTLSFTGFYRGEALFPASRVWTEQYGGDVTKTLNDVVETAEMAIGRIGDVEQIIDDAESATQAASDAAAYSISAADNASQVATGFINAENDRAAAESTRISNEIERLSNEAARQSSELSRVSDESNRATSESARESNESQRIANETSRDSAENNRISAESSRASTENDRVTAEYTRISNETTRQDTENNRNTAEGFREETEADRESAESTRVSNESDRVSAESSRATAETGRSSNESTRQTNESDRESAEALRVNAESIRESNELTRQSQEVTRQNNSTDVINVLNNTNDAFSVCESYNNTSSYKKMNKVTYNGRMYVCIEDSTGNLPTNTMYWLLAADKGVDGTGSGTVVDVKSTSGDLVVSDGSVNPDISISQTLKDAWNGKQDALGFTPENTAKKGVAGGYAELDGSGKVPSSQLPPIEDVSWENLTGKPTSAVEEIDEAVTQRHAHTNKTVLDDITASKINEWDAKQDALEFTPENVANKGTAGGYAELDAGAKIPEANLPDSILGQLDYQGTWDASTNTPTIPAASSSKNFYYVTEVAGEYGGKDYDVGDWIISNGTDWQKVDNTDAVPTVFGRMGNIVAAPGDYNAGQITFTPPTGMTSTDVQTGIVEIAQELDTAAKADGTLQENLNADMLDGKHASEFASVDGIVTLSGIDWVLRTPAATNAWRSVCYGKGLFVSVSDSRTGNRIMTSPDGINWTIRSSAADNAWRSVCYGNGLFVAVSGTENGVMTSPDGINWTLRTSAADDYWWSVCYGNGMFVAVAFRTAGSGVMTSPDGINWTIRTPASDSAWHSVCYGNGLFVAVAGTGPSAGNRVMTSPDGITWTTRTGASDNQWMAVCYGNGLFVAVSGSGTGNRVMTSPDGITWTSRISAADVTWNFVCYGNGMFVAVSSSNQIMTSPDGINWTIRANASSGIWLSVCYGNEMFVAVSSGGAGRVVTSGLTNPDVTALYQLLSNLSS